MSHSYEPHRISSLKSPATPHQTAIFVTKNSAYSILHDYTSTQLPHEGLALQFLCHRLNLPCSVYHPIRHWREKLVSRHPCWQFSNCPQIVNCCPPQFESSIFPTLAFFRIHQQTVPSYRSTVYLSASGICQHVVSRAAQLHGDYALTWVSSFDFNGKLSSAQL